jgi:capsule polysaccharide export protein KpsE/RkpR
MDIIKMTIEQALEFTVNHTRGSTFSPNSWDAKTAMLVMAKEIESLRQQLAEQTSGEPVGELTHDVNVRNFEFAEIKLNTAIAFKLPAGAKVYTAPPSVEVLLEALRKIVEVDDSTHYVCEQIANDALNAYSSKPQKPI